MGHDAGHNGVSGRRLVDSLLGVGLGNALTGVGIGWWKARFRDYLLLRKHTL